ncbi:MAG: (d)CMP kinase [Paludibacteraceae bacterium]|nr:(d)CMP kinase [Paludibacteraceae bacterium]
MKRIIVAIDGYSSCGKSTIAKSLARHAGYTYVDTGAMYRAVGLYCLQHGLISPESTDQAGLQEALTLIRIEFRLQPDGSQHTLLNGQDVEQAIRTLEVSDAASRVSVLPFVRRHLVAQQQLMGKAKGIVMDGRDIGTVVFPDAELKLFITAAPEVRAERRYKELLEKGEQTTLEEVLAATNERDYRDTHRAESPLRKADDAVTVDNSHLTREEQMQVVEQLFQQAIAD